MHLRLVGHIQTVRLFQRSLFMRKNVDVTFDAFLSHVAPRVSAHPFPLALRALVLAKTPLPALVGRLALALGTRLRAVLDVVPFPEAQMT